MTASQLARAWGVSRQNIHALAKKGLLPRGPDGLFDEDEARRAYYRNTDPAFRRALPPKPVNSYGVVDDACCSHSRARRAAAEAGLAQLAYETKAGVLVDGKAVEREWFETLRTLRDRLLSVPDRLAPVLAAETDPVEVSNLIFDELAEILHEAAPGLSEL
ncbi:hypothetical protein [Aestuariivirga sp.]|uniref:hypothetical protein n=1 Tax=Aestuariivirga sp. TaxID=2650926 RepID=UPI00391DF234